MSVKLKDAQIKTIRDGADWRWVEHDDGTILEILSDADDVVASFKKGEIEGGPMKGQAAS